MIKRVSLNNCFVILYIILASITDEGSSLMKLARVALVAVCAFNIMRNHKIKILCKQYIGWLFLFICISGISASWAVNKGQAMNMTKTLSINCVCMLCLLYLIQLDKKKHENAYKALIYSPLLLEIRVILNGGLLAFLHSRNAGGINGNTVGLCAAFGACFALYFILKNENKYKYGILFALNVIITVLSSSRKALLCILIPLLFLYIYQNKKNIFAIIGRVIIAVIAAILVYVAIIKIPALYKTVGHRIESMVALMLGLGGVVDASALTRSNLTNWGIAWFKLKPWLGYGIDNYRFVLHQYHSDYPLSFYAHNNYVELLVDVGIVGFVAYYSFYFRTVVNYFKSRKVMEKCDYLILGVFLGLVISEYGLVSYYDKYIQILLLLIFTNAYMLMGNRIVKHGITTDVDV